MPRTTLNLDATILDELRRRQRVHAKSLGQLASELLAEAIARSDDSQEKAPASLRWSTRRMGARVDLEDSEAVRAALDEA